jgi:hypothetical protein
MVILVVLYRGPVEVLRAERDDRNRTERSQLQINSLAIQLDCGGETHALSPFEIFEPGISYGDGGDGASRCGGPGRAQASSESLARGLSVAVGHLCGL